jgi:hypothetical protein
VRKIVKLNPTRVVLCCLLAVSSAVAQDTAQPAPSATPQTTGLPTGPQTLPPPKYVPSEENTGRGFSIEPFYMMGNYQPSLHTGLKFSSTTTNSGDLDYSKLNPRVYGALVSIPASKTSMIRISYFQGKAPDFVVATQPITLFKVADAQPGDGIAADHSFSAIKVSLDYLTYYWNVGKSELRLKTYWEVQRVGITNNVTVFPLLSDGTIGTPLPAGQDFNIILPTIGAGFEHTLGRHFRWEAKGTGMYFGSSRPYIGEADASVNFRYGRWEFSGGGKYFSFKTSSNADQYIKGSVFGPIVGIRYYWHKEKTTAGTAAAPTR